MIDIKPLIDVSADALRTIITGYTTDERYQVSSTEADAETTLRLELIKLDTPYTHVYDETDDYSLAMYRAALKHDLSLGAYDGETLVGIALAEPHVWNKILWVWEFHLAPAYRGQGVGARLMNALADKATAAGLRAIVCETQAANVPAIRFYRKLGFAVHGIDLSYYTNADVEKQDVAVFMKRLL